VIGETGAAGPQDTNKVIPVVMKEMKGKADGKVIQEIIKEELMMRAAAIERGAVNA